VTLHVISVISNPVRYRTRIKLFKETMERMKVPGVVHWIVEASFGHRPASVIDPDNPHHIHVRCDHELWLKENLINVGARHLPHDAKYLMWLDGDVRFEREDWAQETIEALQHHAVVQPFSDVVDYGPHGEILERHRGFFYCWLKGLDLGPKNRLCGWKYGGPYWHPGYACAFRMDAWNALGGMIDRAICGSADYHMACALIGQAARSYPGTVHKHYKHMIGEWQRRAHHAVGQNIGYVPGTVHHHFHGHKADRKYRERWSILIDNNYDPYSDVCLDRQGVLQFAAGHHHDPRMRKMVGELRAYFRGRDEDAR
jgi:hypothetical protein